MSAPKSLRARIVARRRKINRWTKSPSGQRWLTRTGPALSVFLVSAYVSYGHIESLTLAAGQSITVAAIMAIAVDGLMVVSGNYITAARTRVGKVWAVTGFLVGLLASLAANVLSAPPTVLGRAVGAFPAIALVLTAGVLHWGDKRPKTKRKPAVVAPKATVDPAPAVGTVYGLNGHQARPGVLADAFPR